jgi:hypothetical protein
LNYLKRYCASIVTAVVTRHSRPVFRRCRVKFELIISEMPTHNKNHSDNYVNCRIFRTCDIFAVRRSSCATTENIWGKIMNLLTILIRDYRPLCCSCIGSNDNSVLATKQALVTTIALMGSTEFLCTLNMIPAMVVPVFFAFFMIAPEALFASSHAFLPKKRQQSKLLSRSLPSFQLLRKAGIAALQT